MNKFDPPSNILMAMYALAAVSGGLGGCAAASFYFTHGKQLRWPFVLAYFVLGIAFGVITLAIMIVGNFNVDDMNKVIIYSGFAGTSGSIVLASANLSAKAYFKRLGIEVQVTLRRPEEDRRAPEPETQPDEGSK